MSRTPFIWRRQCAGFTLIELLVVIVILGILMAVAVPTFLAQQSKAQDSRTEQYLTTAFKAIRSGTVGTNQYPVSTSMVSWITQSEPELTAASGSCITQVQTAAQDEILVDPSSTPTSLTLCARSQSGNVWKLTASNTGVQSLLNGTLLPLTFSGNEITDANRSVQGDGRSGDSSTGIWEATTNLLPNGGFESSSGDWFYAGGGTGTITRTSSEHLFGSSSLQVQTNGDATSQGADTTSNVVAVSAGTTYSASAWVKLTTAEPMFINIGWYDGATFLSNSSQTYASVPAGVWSELTLTGTAPASATQANIRVRLSGTIASTFYIDGAQIEQKSYSTPYVETSFASATRGAAMVQAPASTLSATQGWVAMRLRMGPSSSVRTNTAYTFSWNDNGANNQILTRWSTGQSWVTGMVVGGVSNANALSSTAGSFSAGQLVTVISAWTTSTLYLSVNGENFVSVPRTVGTPSGLPATFTIGGLGTAFQTDGDVLWFACGTGTLVNADAAQINGFGNADPKLAAFPAAAQTTMVWDGSSSASSLK